MNEENVSKVKLTRNKPRIIFSSVMSGVCFANVGWILPTVIARGEVADVLSILILTLFACFFLVIAVTLSMFP